MNRINPHYIPPKDAAGRFKRNRPIQTPLQIILRHAQEDLCAAKRYFDNVSDPEQVDAAIRAMDAAERKYMYVLRLAKKEESK